MQRVNDHHWEIEKINQLKLLKDKPRLLMHSCCAVCNSWPLEYLAPIFEITLYYNNSNIYPEREYQTRISELKNYVEQFNKSHGTNIQVIEEMYDYKEYHELYLSKRADDKEGSLRCGMCYALRINQTLQYASTHHFDYVTTVMTISRQKSSDKINGIVRKLVKAYPNVEYFYSNFKKEGGINFSVATAKSLVMYRQEYCGCEYSIHDPKLD
jgi:predicted adenine nucleotide alpha hydrolase (AANH) superfamily ATPase